MSIKRFLIACSIPISCLLLTGACSPKITTSAFYTNDSEGKISCFNFSDTANLHLRTTLIFNNIQLSGITVVHLKNDTVTGMFMNEFGVSGFSFKTRQGKCKWLGMMPKMNKWYIKKTLSEDLSFIFMTYSDTPDKQAPINKSTLSRYELNNVGKILQAKRIATTCRQKEKQVTGILTNNNDTIRFKNAKRNLTYTFLPLQ